MSRGELNNFIILYRRWRLCAYYFITPPGDTSTIKPDGFCVVSSGFYRKAPCRIFIFFNIKPYTVLCRPCRMHVLCSHFPFCRSIINHNKPSVRITPRMSNIFKRMAYFLFFDYYRCGGRKVDGGGGCISCRRSTSYCGTCKIILHNNSTAAFTWIAQSRPGQNCIIIPWPSGVRQTDFDA